jgi:hypothetical protein
LQRIRGLGDLRSKVSNQAMATFVKGYLTGSPPVNIRSCDKQHNSSQAAHEACQLRNFCLRKFLGWRGRGNPTAEHNHGTAYTTDL